MRDWLTKHIHLPEKVSETTLLFRAKHGDRQAFAKLYEHYLTRMYRYIFYKVEKDTFVAEDLTASVFLKAMEHLQSFQIEGNFRAWLYRIAHNAVIDHYRTRKRSVQLGEHLLSDVDIEKSFALRERANRLSGALAFLTEEQREAILLRYVEDLPSKEIATIMQKQDDAIRALIHRGLQKLREVMGRDYGNI